MGSGFAGKKKQVTLRALAGLVADGSSISLGGSFLHRGSFAFVPELTVIPYFMAQALAVVASFGRRP